MLISVDFLISISGAEREQANINEDAFSARNIKEYSTALSIVAGIKLVINSYLQEV